MSRKLKLAEYELGVTLGTGTSSTDFTITL